jgi:hypothetical protein
MHGTLLTGRATSGEKLHHSQVLLGYADEIQLQTLCMSLCESAEGWLVSCQVRHDVVLPCTIICKTLSQGYVTLPSLTMALPHSVACRGL